MTGKSQRNGWMRVGAAWVAAVAVAGVVPTVVAFVALENAHIARQSERAAATQTVNADVAAAFNRIGFNARKLGKTPTAVPRVLLTALPRALPHITNVGQRKALFLTSMLPLVLQVNEIIGAERDRLLSLVGKNEAGFKLNAEERKWLEVICRKYRVKRQNYPMLLRRVNVIPPSLALAQGAIESGWGTSRFAQKGNAIFGQWTWGEDGMIPLERPNGSSHRVKTFDRLIESVAAYARNLNTHPAYRELREIREKLAESGESITGLSLIAGLDRYSEHGESYVHDLTVVIRANGLSRFDDASLAYSAIASRSIGKTLDIVAAR